MADQIVITRETFLKQDFQDPAPGEWVVTWDARLERFREYQETILLGIMECLVGYFVLPPKMKKAYLAQLRADGATTIEYPEDFGQHGQSNAVINFDQHTVHIMNMITSQTPVHRFFLSEGA